VNARCDWYSKYPPIYLSYYGAVAWWHRGQPPSPLKGTMPPRYYYGMILNLTIVDFTLWHFVTKETWQPPPPCFSQQLVTKMILALVLLCYVVSEWSLHSALDTLRDISFYLRKKWKHTSSLTTLRRMFCFL